MMPSPRMMRCLLLSFPIAMMASRCATIIRAQPVHTPHSGKLNIVLIVADDLGYGDLGCYGGDDVETPHIDRLAKESIRFTDYHTSGPMCTPTRVSMLTGQYQQRFGPLFDGPLAGDHQKHLGLPLDAITVAERLQEAGYRTGCFGKWHLGFRAPFLPTRQGFDVFRGLTAGDGDHHTQVNRYGEPDWWHNEARVAEDGYTTDLITEHTIQFIRSNQDQAFFAFVPHLAIHFPWQGPSDPPQREVGTDYKADKWGIIPDPKNVRPHVQAMIQSIDHSTGRILGTLEQLGLRDQTLVIFTSDNGGYLTYGDRFSNISNNGPLRGQKSTLYEGGHRVPLLISHPTRTKPRAVSFIAHSNDLFPTLLSVANVPKTRRADEDLDGIDLSPLLDDKPLSPNRQLFWRAGEEWAVRDGRWKLVFEDQTLQLFDLEKDLGESHNLAAKHPDRVSQLKQAWQTWQTDVATVK